MEINFLKNLFKFGVDKDKNLIVNKYEGVLTEPKKTRLLFWLH